MTEIELFGKLAKYWCKIIPIFQKEDHSNNHCDGLRLFIHAYKPSSEAELKQFCEKERTKHLLMALVAAKSTKLLII